MAEAPLARAPRETLETLVREAARAPSVHNVQPARWRFDETGVTLLREPGRELPVGDPTGHDLRASLGAAFEGMRIALSRHGLKLGDPVLERSHAPQARIIPVASAYISEGADEDPLAGMVQVRRSHRGRFAPATPEASAALQAVSADDAVVVLDQKSIAAVVELHDRATWTFESRSAYHEELWSWLRLTPGDPRWSRDGLNADCLALSALEREAARILLRPPAFAILSRLGVARLLVSEAPQVRSSTGIVLFTPSRGLSAFDVGRRFYRLWLEITAAGLYAAPMSASADDPDTNHALRGRFGIPDERRIANVLRVGRAPATGVALSPRLPTSELTG